jgi:hypothetical protein
MRNVGRKEVDTMKLRQLMVILYAQYCELTKGYYDGSRIQEVRRILEKEN